jgi:hypothetical protein
MGDAFVLGAILIAIGLVAWPAARRWFRSSGSRPLVDPDQNITIEEAVPGVPGWYQTRYRNRVLPRGRRHKAPPGAVVHRRDRDSQDQGPISRR